MQTKMIQRCDEEIINLEARLSHLRKLSENTQIDQNFLRKQELDTNTSLITLNNKWKDEAEKFLHENNRLLDENLKKEKVNTQSEELLQKGREEVQKMYSEFKIESEKITSSMHQDQSELEKQQRYHKELETKKFSLQKSFLEERNEIHTTKDLLLKNIQDANEKINNLKDQLENNQAKKGKVEKDMSEIKHKNQKLTDELDNLKFESQKQISS